MAVEIVLELALVVMPIYLSTAVQITLGRKITVVGAFFPRIMYVAPPVDQHAPLTSTP